MTPHSPGCPATRTETTTTDTVIITRCIDCGTQTAHTSDGHMIPAEPTPDIVGALAGQTVGSTFRDITWDTPTHQPATRATREWSTYGRGHH